MERYLQRCLSELKRQVSWDGTSLSSTQQISFSMELHLLCSTLSSPSWKSIHTKVPRMMKLHFSFWVASISRESQVAGEGQILLPLKNEHENQSSLFYQEMELVFFTLIRFWFYQIRRRVLESMLTVERLWTLQYFYQSVPLGSRGRGEFLPWRGSLRLMGGSFTLAGVFSSGIIRRLASFSGRQRPVGLSEYEMVRCSAILLLFWGDLVADSTGRTLKKLKASSFSALWMRYLLQLLILLRWLIY